MRVAVVWLLIAGVTRADMPHWSFVAPQKYPVPLVKQAERVADPIDAFVLAQLEAKGISPAPLAAQRDLLRRVSFDLIGLPPNPAEAQAFLTDTAPNAYEKLVDRLLASPHFGERQAQHWLDVARYAESNGYETDRERPNAWRYRDYVIHAFNTDKPYDRFVIEQLAGDLLPEAKDALRNPTVHIATGMNRCGPSHVVAGNLDPELLRQETLTEYVQGVGTAFLGLTFHCARCHDHKFDPISQADYYRIEAFFARTQFREVDIATDAEKAAFRRELLDRTLELSPAKSAVTQFEEPIRTRLQAAKRAALDPHYIAALDAKKRTPEQEKLAKDANTLLKVTWDEILAVLTPAEREERDKLIARRESLEAKFPAPPAQAWSVADDEKPLKTHVLRRSDPAMKGAVVEAGYPSLFVSKVNEKNLTRLDLARWMTQANHPLTARVIVNRVWQHHFGKPLVATPNDFGLHGARPTHPELLDRLAVDLVESGWKLKGLHRRMVLSDTYRRASDVAVSPADPENRLYGKMNRRRIDGETLRDAILTVSGNLNRDVGGPMVRVPIEPEVYDLIFTEAEPIGLWPITPDVKQHTRRSIYLFAKRNVRLPLLEVFDQPDRLTPCGERPTSIIAPQALILMNGPFAGEQARAMAEGLLKLPFTTRIDAAYGRAFARAPTSGERATAIKFLARQTQLIEERLVARLPVEMPQVPEGVTPAEAAAFADFCQALFNVNAFMYVP